MGVDEFCISKFEAGIAVCVAVKRVELQLLPTVVVGTCFWSGYTRAAAYEPEFGFRVAAVLLALAI